MNAATTTSGWMPSSRQPARLPLSADPGTIPVIGETVRTKIVILGMMLVLGCRHEKQAESAPLPVTVAQVAGTSGSGGARYSASLTPDVEVDAAFKVSGYVEQILQVKGA